jgi:hypothetical protein
MDTPDYEGTQYELERERERLDFKLMLRAPLSSSRHTHSAKRDACSSSTGLYNTLGTGFNQSNSAIMAAPYQEPSVRIRTLTKNSVDFVLENVDLACVASPRLLHAIV